MTTRDPAGQEPDEETIDEPIQDGAVELRAEAVRAVESGDVDLTDTSRGGPSVADPPH